MLTTDLGNAGEQKHHRARRTAAFHTAVCNIAANQKIYYTPLTIHFFRSH